MKKRIILRILAVIFFAILAVFALFLIIVATNYGHANEAALEAMEGSEDVVVREIPEGWLFDGPSEDTAIVFYVGFRIEERAYAPVLLLTAQESADVFLVKMPFYIAYCGVNLADDIRSAYSYEHWYMMGHSLGAMAGTTYASSCEDTPDGVILLASYLRENTSMKTKMLVLYGSEDKVLNTDNVAAMQTYLPEGSVVHCIEGGNHGQFGSYGQQKGDGHATITPEEQWKEAADWIHWFIRGGDPASAPDAEA